jgi:hypothetical protein
MNDHRDTGRDDEAVSAHDDRGWEPPDDLKDHRDAPIPRDAEFFHPPPKEIGHLFSAYSTLKFKHQPKSLGVRLVIAALGGAVGAGVGFGLSLIAGDVWQIIWLVLFPILGLAIGFGATSFKHTCTYVGAYGLAKYTCSKSRENVKEEIFLFESAAEVRTGLTAHYTNGVYQRTEYYFKWTDERGRIVYKITGSHRSKDDNPPAGDLYNFGRAAEFAWSVFLYQDADRQIRERGEYEFGLTGSDFVRMGKGWVEFNLRGQTYHCSKDELATYSLANGQLTIKRADAKEGWFSSKGVFKFPYREIGNARLFLILFEKLAAP